MVRALGAVLLAMTVTSSALGEEPTRPEADAGAALSPAAASDTPPTAEERVFAAELERFARRRSFTEQLMAQREAEAFEQATRRQMRVAKLQRELTEREAALSERELGEAVALYLKKRKLTQELALAASRAKTGPQGSSGVPSTSPSPSSSP